MTRMLKPKPVATVRDGKLDAEIEIMLDRNDLTFFFEVGGEREKFADADAAKRAAREALKRVGSLEWEPVIMVNHDVQRGGWCPGHRDGERRLPREAKMEISFKRCERTRVDGKWRLVRPHVEDVDAGDDRVAERRAANHGERYVDHGQEVLPYSEAAWHALHAIVGSLHEANDKLAQLLASPDAATLLSAYSRKLLGGGS